MPTAKALLTRIMAPSEPDMARVNRMVRTRLGSDVGPIGEMGEHIISSGGKRLRPALVCLCARACDYTGDHHIDLAAIVEFIHTATLLHDDVVDASTLRRGQVTANEIWGDHMPVLVGDFLYSRAFQMMVEVGRPEVMSILATATNTISEGEVLQLLNAHNTATDEAAYFEIIRRKTSELFSAACKLGALIADKSRDEQADWARFGLHFGNAFQLIDDVLDYSASPDETGKNLGDDLTEGKPTLPLIYAAENGTETERQLIHQAIKNGGTNQLEAVTAIIERTGAITYTVARAEQEADKALTTLANVPGSPYREALIDLTRFSVSRTH
ncbi:MAG: polyprenyl synthetase family protein [Gammaproteobacteria bacterium]|nr:polyprenyl synthetase family protein [Gammaproteobacteria bacterium]